MMSETDAFDSRLREMMSDAAHADDQDGGRFSGIVLQSLAKRRRLRALVLRTTGAAGLLVTGVALGGIVARLAPIGERLIASAGAWVPTEPGAFVLLILAGGLIVAQLESSR